MKVSVIIPCFRQASFLPRTIRSVTLQDVEDLEIIVVDDGSPDDVPGAVEPFGSAVTLIRQENQGVAAARNTGIAASSGELLNFLDADDLLGNRMLSQHVRAAKRSPEADVFYSSFYLIDRAGNKTRYERAAVLCDDPFLQILSKNPFPPPCSITLRRSALPDDGRFDSKIQGCADWDMWLRLAARGCDFRAVPDSFVLYRKHVGSMSRNPFRMWDDYLGVVDKVSRYMAQNDGLERVRLRSRKRVRAMSYNLMFGQCNLLRQSGNPLGCARLAFLSTLKDPRFAVYSLLRCVGRVRHAAAGSAW